MMMDTITAIAPVSPPAPVNESQAPRECKEEEGAKKDDFDKKLKKELSLLAPDAADAKDPAAAAAEDALAADAVAVVDPAVAGLIDPNLAAQNAAALAQAAAAARATGRDTGARGEHGDAAVTGIDAAAAERASAERGLGERGVLERDATRRVVSERDMKQRVAGDIADAKAARESDEGEISAEKFAVDTPKDSPMPAIGVGPERTAVTNVAGQHGGQSGSVGTGNPVDGLSSLSLLAHRAGAAPGALDIVPAQVTAKVDTPLGTAGWGDAFNQRIMFLVDRQQQSAELHINPPHLGPVDIMLNLNNDTASLAFVSPHAAVREAIEASLPDLQTALNQRGLEMAQTLVSADSSSAREQFSQATADAGSGNGGRDGSRQNRGGPATGPLVVDAPRRVVASRGLVDIFA
jgi:flagellar hook-length control protein FliK